jgi:hypothetical protein
MNSATFLSLEYYCAFCVLRYFPFGVVKRLDVVAEFFNLFNSANVSQINPVFRLRFDSDARRPAALR